MKRVVLVAAMVVMASFAVMAETTYVDLGETLTIESQDQADALAGTDLRLLGTLDLKGFDVTFKSLSSVATNKTVNGWAVGSTSALITNSAPEAATFTVTAASYYNGHVAPSVNFTSDGAELQVLCDDQAFAPAKFTMKKSTAMFLSRPTTIHFTVTDVAADGESVQKLLRLSELMMTFRGVPIVDYNAWPLTHTAKDNWFDMRANNSQYWSQSVPVSQTPAVFAVSVGKAGGDGSYGCAAVDGYRLSPPTEPAYTPTSWKVYASRGEKTGVILLDERKDDPLNRPAISTATAADNWSNRLSQNYEFNRLTLGSPIGANTDIEITTSSTTLRISTVTPFKFGNLSGQGKVQIDDGSVFAPAGLDGWTGSFTTLYSGQFGREAKVAVAGAKGSPAFANSEIVLVGSGEGSEVVCDGTQSVSNLRLADGESPLGVTVNPGDGKTVCLLSQNAGYSGETKVASGTLSVLAPRASVTCQYIRIAPKKVPSIDSYHVYWAMNEFAVYDEDGQPIDLKTKAASVTASNTAKQWSDANSYNGTKLIDGDVSTRCLPYGDELVTVTIKTKEPIAFSSYDWYPSVNNGSPSKNRYPIELQIEVSSDGANWVVADYRTLVQPTQDDDYSKWQGGDGHFKLCYRNLETLPAEFAGSTAPDSSFVQTVKAQYFRFSPYETFYGGKFTSTGYGWHVSELSLMKDGEIVPWPANATAMNDGCAMSATANGNKITNIADNLYPGCGQSGVNRCFLDQCGGCVIINAGEVVEFDAYELWNGTMPEGLDRRMPRVWSIAVSMDKENWHVIDSHVASATDVCPDRYGAYGPFSLKNRWPVNSASNAIGDESPVDVANGATFDLQTPYERVGGLSGSGSVRLGDARLVLNGGTRARTFAGAVSGVGELVLETGVQTFDGADLSGVANLVFAGGAFAGTATFGALKVTGDVKISLPDDLVRGCGSTTVFAYDSIDADSKAALEAATFQTSFAGKRQIEISVGETSTVVTVRKNGMLLFFR